jgi:putative nucleotidyltransferase with HDIG domain
VGEDYEGIPMYAETNGNDRAGVVEAATLERDEDSEHVVIGRLIRRLRVSESPERFHALATNVLRSSLAVEAVAWVPRDGREPVIVSGLVDEMEPSLYRLLAQSAVSEGDCRADDGAQGRRPRGLPGSVDRYTTALAGSAGWLVAINPLRGRAFTPSEVERLHYVGALIEAQLANARIYTELKGLLFGIIRALTAAIDAKDPDTSGHSERVARIAVRIAEELAIPSSRRSDLYLAGLLHDVGKIGIDDDVLKKSGPLSADEYRRIQCHVEIGVNILRDLKRLSHILPGVRHHHESFDGSGYPDHLSGEEIPLEARILAVADSFDAMSSNRTYRKRLSLMQIDEIFRKGRGHQWDPEVVDALFACRADVEAIRQKGLGESLIGAVDVALGRA